MVQIALMLKSSMIQVHTKGVKEGKGRTPVQAFQAALQALDNEYADLYDQFKVRLLCWQGLAVSTGGVEACLSATMCTCWPGQDLVRIHLIQPAPTKTLCSCVDSAAGDEGHARRYG